MKIKGFEILLNEDAYEPREDSILLASAVEEFLKNNKIEKVLDTGTGTGIQALIASRFCKNVMAIDINPRAVELARENAKINKAKNIDFIASDLFENVEGKFDLIIFNPPYLPVDDRIKGAGQWSGGKTGRKILKRFAVNVKKYLKKDGIILIVISSLTGLDEVKKIFEENEFKTKIAKTKKIPWETLYALEIKIKT